MTILCGTDLSDAARAGAEAAAALAVRTGDSVVLTHVAEVQPVRADLAALTAMLEQEAAAVRKLGVTVNPEVRSGLPDEELCRLTREFSARLLVVSALGRRSPSRWRLGSVAERVAWDCGVPALVVRGSDVWRAWAWSDRKLRIAVGYDASEAGDAALRWAVELARRGPADLVLVHVYSPDAESLRLGVTRPAELSGRRAEIENFLTQELHLRMRGVVSGDLPRLVLESGQGRAGRHVIQVAERESADVLVVGSHHRVGLERAVRGSVSEDVLHYAPMSVACVPLPTADAAAATTERRIRRVLVTTDLSSIGDRAIPHAYAQLPDGGLAVLLSVI
ncbi:MAG: universal stress protein, partial [Burkholderiales bacterium]|nr:universal stress protein [Burkholderiales bacterium]